MNQKPNILQKIISQNNVTVKGLNAEDKAELKRNGIDFEVINFSGFAWDMEYILVFDSNKQSK